MQLNYDKTQLKTFCTTNNINYLGLFGSYARNEGNGNSDIDLLVEYSKTPSLLKHIGIENKLSETIFENKKIDLITKRTLNKHIAPYIQKDLVTIYQHD